MRVSALINIKCVGSNGWIFALNVPHLLLLGHFRYDVITWGSRGFNPRVLMTNDSETVKKVKGKSTVFFNVNGVFQSSNVCFLLLSLQQQLNFLYVNV